MWCLSCVATTLFWVSLLSFLVPFLIHAYAFKEQDLKKKYRAEWALVTGASSGIGRALTEKLAKQGINVAMVALDDDLFQTVFKQMQSKFPKVKFVRIGCNLAKPGYLPTIVEATKDLPINLVFNNAGYIITGNFADFPLERSMDNYECNATAPMAITHHFANSMLDKKLKGAICFTSSPAGLMPTPMTCMYGATKAFLTTFASSIAPELRGDGIDVLVVHPSPVDTGFYSGNKHEVSAMKLFQRTATSPERIADCFFTSVGRTVIHEQGYYCLVLRIIFRLIDQAIFTDIINWTARWVGDMKKTKRDRSSTTSETKTSSKSKSPPTSPTKSKSKSSKK